MSKFVYGTELTLTIEKIIINAQEHLFLVAPSISLPQRLKEELRRKKMQDSLQLTVVFGNGDQGPTGISDDNLLFLEEFPNVVICYEEKLRVNYYANENTALFTSISLHAFTENTNVEAGMVMNAKGMFKQLAGNITNSITDTEKSSWDTASDYFAEVISKSRELYRKTPQYEKGFMNLSKKYSRSIVETDKLDEFLAQEKPVVINGALTTAAPQPATAADKQLFFTEYTIEEPVKPAVPEATIPMAEPEPVKADDEFQPGYCIRTGAAMFFNPRSPMSAQALAEWKKESDAEFPENYCHFSGEPSYGQTSYNRPILQKNLKKAQVYMG
jgi:hypothetical protein